MRKAVVPLVLAISLTAALSCSSSSAPATAPPATPAAKRPPVVLIVFDEFPTPSLLNSRRRIDAIRYPNFARLARESTWFPNATASLDKTGEATESLLTGRTLGPLARPFPVKQKNLFLLMARRYRLNVSEEVMNLCPRRLCPSSRPQSKRSILRKLARGRPQRFDRWVRSLRPSRRRPTFYFKHVLFPHGPWRYLPSGRFFAAGPSTKRYSWDLIHFTRWLVNQNYQKHLLQLGLTDRLLGKALARLRATGLYDRSLVVVTADNGEGFGRLGNGHEINRANAGDIALTPLFIKLPRQKSGRIVRRHVRTIDVLPTIARIAKLRVPWRVEGRSVFGRSARRIPSTTVLYQRSGNRIRLSARSLNRRGLATVRRKARLFGSGDGPPGLFGIGPARFLHGTPVSRWRLLAPGRTRAAIDLAGRFKRVRRSSGFVPVRVMGILKGRGSRKRLNLAVAVNGTIVATGPTFPPARGRAYLFSVIVPEAALRDGSNSVKLYAIVGRGKSPQLRPLTL